MPIAISESSFLWDLPARISHDTAEPAGIQALKIFAEGDDRHGSLLHLLRIPGVRPTPDHRDRQRLYGSKLPRRDGGVGKILPKRSPAVQQGAPLRPRRVLISGGIPVMHEDYCVGVGASKRRTSTARGWDLRAPPNWPA